MTDGSARLAWEQARANRPGVAVPLDAFARALAGADPATLATDDVYLALACAAGDRLACEAFDREHVARIPSFLARIERDASVLDEVMQRVRTRVLVGDGERPARVGDYAGRGSLSAWVRVVALRTHAHLVAERRSAHRLESDAALDFDAAVIPLDLAVARQEHRATVERALAAALRGLPPRDRTVLRMHYVDGLSLEKIGRVYAVDKATVSRWLRATRERIADDALAQVQEETGANAEDARSLLGLLLSAMSLSLPGLLRSIDASAPT